MADFRERIVKRVARELKDGDYVNLGIGMPTLVANYVPAGIDITAAVLALREIAADTTVDKVKAATGAALIVPDTVGTFS